MAVVARYSGHHRAAQDQIDRIRKAVGKQQQVALDEIAPPVELLDVEQNQGSGESEREAEERPRAEALVPEEQGHREGEDGNRRRQNGRVDGRREGEAEDEEDLVHRDAQKGEKNEDSAIGPSGQGRASRAANHFEEEGGRGDPQPGQSEGRNSRQGELAEHREEGEAGLGAGEGQMHREAAAGAPRALRRAHAKGSSATMAARDGSSSQRREAPAQHLEKRNQGRSIQRRARRPRS